MTIFGVYVNRTAHYATPHCRLRKKSQQIFPLSRRTAHTAFFFRIVYGIARFQKGLKCLEGPLTHSRTRLTQNHASNCQRNTSVKLEVGAAGYAQPVYAHVFDIVVPEGHSSHALLQRSLQMMKED